MDNEVILQRAGEWMLSRNWKRKVAKRRQFDQSLFEHALVELDAMLQLLPILRLPNHFGLSREEEQVLAASTVGHDVGKERSAWQEYILGQGQFLSDVDPALTRSVLPELCAALGFGDLSAKTMAVIENCVNLHMSRERTDSNIVSALLRGADRWYTLANLVYDLDKVCSAKGVLQAKDALQRSFLRNHVKVAHHQVIIRGVSTTALHRAALDSFQELGWAPLLHFSDATLYVCSAAQPVAEPHLDLIEKRLVEVLKDATGRDVTELIVGSPTANILPKPELFEHSEIRMYLEAAARKVGRESFAKAYQRDKARAARGETATRGKRKPKGAVVEDYWAAISKIGDRYSSEMDRDALRISSAHPDMLAFKFLKAAMKRELVGDEGVVMACQEYEDVFGIGSWAALLGTITLSAAQDMANTVDIFWNLPGQQFGRNVSRVEELAPEMRTELLLDTLSDIAHKVFAAISDPPTRANLAKQMAASFVHDLISPSAPVDLSQVARRQMEFYAASKPFAGKQARKASHLCPICNTPFKEGTKATADFIDKPESHTNRGLAHGPFGYVTVCDSCKYERILRQLLLGDRAVEMLVVFPRMNIGPGAGELLARRAQALYDRAYALMTGDTDEPDRRLWLAFTPLIASQVLGRDLFRLTPQQLVDLLTYRSGEKERIKSRRELQKRLREDFDLEEANTTWGTAFGSWDEATSAVYANEIADTTARQIRADVYRLHPQMRLVCQTPHMIMLPLTYPISLGDDSETNAALRRVFVALLLGLFMDASVAIVRDSDQIDFQGGEGVAFVPPVAAARDLIGANWVPLSQAERWLRRIGLASILAASGRYSDRTGLFRVLTAPTAGHVLRRIEQKRAADGQRLGYEDIRCLRAFEEVMRG